MGINEVVTAIETWIRTYDGVVATQVRPSPDDTDVIKIWVDLGEAGLDRRAWLSACEAALLAAIPAAAEFRLQIRAE